MFDDMLQRSIPQYNAMRMVTYEVGRSFVQPGTAIIDMGCSRGQALLPFVANFGASNDYIGLEISEPMIDAARQSFAYHEHGNRVSIQSADLRHEFPNVTSSLVLSVLTLQFTPIEYRQQIIRRVYESLAPGGCEQGLFIEGTERSGEQSTQPRMAICRGGMVGIADVGNFHHIQKRLSPQSTHTFHLAASTDQL